MFGKLVDGMAHDFNNTLQTAVGGRLDVQAVNVRITGEEVSGIRPDDYVRMSIEANLKQIPAEGPNETVELVLTAQRSEQASPRFAHVRMLAEQSGGSVDIQDHEGQGIRIVLLLPRAFHLAAPPEASFSSRDVESIERRCVLFVDDDPLVCQSVVPVLEAIGLNVKSAHDPAGALALLSRSAIDVVITDIVMPNEGGVELAHEIKRRHPDIPVLLATGYAADLARWPHPILHKPYTIQNITDALREALDTAKRPR
jgi:CheY-like chemotaxis protein